MMQPNNQPNNRDLAHLFAAGLPSSAPIRSSNAATPAYLTNDGAGGDINAYLRQQQLVQRQQEYALAARRQAILGLQVGSLDSMRANNDAAAAALAYAEHHNELLELELAIEARVDQVRGAASGMTGNSASSIVGNSASGLLGISAARSGPEGLRFPSRTSLPGAASFFPNMASHNASLPSSPQALPWNRLSSDQLRVPRLEAMAQSALDTQHHHLTTGSHYRSNFLQAATKVPASSPTAFGSSIDKTETMRKKVPTSTEKQASACKEEKEDDEYFSKPLPQKERFPVKLYRMIYEAHQAGKEDVVAFLPHGKAFAIHDEATFVRDILPLYFPGCQLPSFQKQLNLYGFHKITVGKDKGKLHYFHKHFLKGKPSLSETIQRRRPRK